MPGPSQSDPNPQPSARQRAEAAWAEKHRSPPDPSLPVDAVMHELEVHQIQLEMQNEELRRIQMELEVSSDELMDLYDLAPVGYCTLDENAVIQRANLTLAGLLGFERNTIVKKRLTFCIARESLGAFNSFWTSLMAGDPSRSCDLILRTAEGASVPVSFQTVDPVRPNGARWFRCAIIDITGRKRAEDALQEAYANLACELENARWLQQISILLIESGNEQELYGQILETAMLIMRADCASIQVLDEEDGSLHLLAWRNFTPESAEHWRTVATHTGTSCGSSLSLGGRVIVPDVSGAGSPVDSINLGYFRQCGIVSIQSTPLSTREGHLVGMISTHWKQPHAPSNREFALFDVLCRQAADWMERSRSQNALRAANERFRRVLETDAVGVLFFNRDGYLIQANDAFLRMTGHSRAQVDARELHWRTLTPPEWIDLSNRQMEQFAETGHIGPYEKEYFCRDGSRRWMLFAGRDLDKDTVCEYCIDITDRKRAEQALRDEDRRKDEFLAVLGHELRNPLSAISTALQLLPDAATPVQRSELEEIMRRQVTLTGRLLDDLLDVGRIKYGHIELKREPVDLWDFLHKANSAVQRNVAERGQELLLHFPPSPVLFMADRVRLDQIINNVLNNASKYSPSGGRIELSAAQEGSDIVFRCKDYGQGISPESHEVIFEPFTRGRQVESGYGEASLGIGLAISKQLTELHGGTIQVKSAGPDLGSEFIVRLPLVAPPQEALRTREPASAAQKHSIIVVEDNPIIRKVMGMALERTGHAVRMFPDGPSALAAIAELNADTFLLDIGLPGMDGYELARKLREHDHLNDARFIAISGFRERKQDAPEDQVFNHYLLKPVDVRALLALLDAPQ